jgi:dimethylaniline monooxygenase (N-oxide forming)
VALDCRCPGVCVKAWQNSGIDSRWATLGASDYRCPIIVSATPTPPSAHFADGSSEELDAIVYATGYRVSFPFFDREVLDAPNNELSLYLRVFPPALPGVAFVGLCQPLGPIMPISEAQAKLVAAALSGRYRLPPVAEMQRAALRERASVRQRFGDSPRHTMQVDFDEYLGGLAEERERGMRRPRQARALPALRT